jgi:hypothetical protein
MVVPDTVNSRLEAGGHGGVTGSHRAGYKPGMQVLRLPFDHHTDGASLRHAAQPRLLGWQAAELVSDTLLVITEAHPDRKGRLGAYADPAKRHSRITCFSGVRGARAGVRRSRAD